MEGEKITKSLLRVNGLKFLNNFATIKYKKNSSSYSQ